MTEFKALSSKELCYYYHVTTVFRKVSFAGEQRTEWKTQSSILALQSSELIKVNHLSKSMETLCLDHLKEQKMGSSRRRKEISYS